MNLLSHQASCKTEVSNMLVLPNGKSKIARLIGEKCIINCFVNKVINTILLETGAQISLVLKDCLEQNHSYLEIEDVSSLLDEADRLRVRWANDADILFVEYVDLLIQLEK